MPSRSAGSSGFPAAQTAMVRSWIAEAVGVPCKFTFGSVYKFNIIALTLLGLISNLIKGEGIGIGSFLGYLIGWGIFMNLLVSGGYSIGCKLLPWSGVYGLALMYLLIAWNAFSVPKKDETPQQPAIVINSAAPVAPVTPVGSTMAPAPQKADAFFKAYDETPL